MKGKLKSYLSCIPDMICYDIKVETDDFILISTDGIFESMDIFQIVSYYIFRPILLKRGTRSWNSKKTPIRLLAVSFRIVKSYPHNPITWQSFSSSSRKEN
jgi:hypothetical protein